MRSVRKAPTSVEHFGELVRHGKYGFRLSRDQYAVPNKTASIRLEREDYPKGLWEATAWAYEDDTRALHSDEYCTKHQQDALENFDLNMNFFSQIPQELFDGALTELTVKIKTLKEVSNLSSVAGVEGVYVMVLDTYRQAYIGKSIDVRARIKSHWAGVKQFDRLLWGNKHESVISIDSFRSLDTTRIFVARSHSTDHMEARMVKSFPADFNLNRIGGGGLNPLRAIFIEQEIKRRRLTSLSYL